MININLNDFSIEDLRNLRNEINANIKSRKTESKETKKIENEKMREELSIKARKYLANKKLGDIVKVYLKDDEVEGKIVKFSEKTFTVEIGDKNVWRYYYQVVIEE